MDLFDIAAKIRLDTKEYEKNISSAEKSGVNLGDVIAKSMTAATTVIVGVVAAVSGVATAVINTTKKIYGETKEVAEYGDQVDKMSQKLGLSKKAYQEWDYVLGQSGADITNMSAGLKTLTNKIDEAKNGGKEATAMFETLGISLDDLNSMTREDAFEAVISGFQRMEDSTERAALANDLFGKSGQELAPLFNTTVDETNELRQAAHDLGLIMSDEAVSASAEFCDSLDTLERTMSGVKNNLLSKFMPAFTTVMDGLSKIFAGDESGFVEIIGGVQDLSKKLIDKIPEFVQFATDLIFAIGTAIEQSLPMLFESGVKILTESIIPGILNNAGDLAEVAFSIIDGLATSIGDALPDLIPMAIETVLTLVGAIIENSYLLVDAAISIILGLLDGIMNAIPTLLQSAPKIIEKLVYALIENLPKIIAMAPKIIVSIITGLISALPDLIMMAPDIIMAIISGLVTGFTDLVGSGKEIVGKIKEGFFSAIDGAKKWGSDMIQNFIDGITAKAQALIQKVKDVARSVKSFLGFSEPEEGPLSDFHTYAPDMMNLFMKGIDDNKDKLQNKVASAFDFGGLITGQGFSGATPTPAFAGASGFNGTIDLYVDGYTLVGSTSKKMDKSLGDADKIKSRYRGRS